MKVIRPYGRTAVTDEKQQQRVFIDLDKNTHNILDHLTTNKRLVLSQWIAMIDKIIRKPQHGKRASQHCYHTRDQLGGACLKLVKESLIKLDEQLVDQELKERWSARLNPYKETKRALEWINDTRGIALCWTYLVASVCATDRIFMALKNYTS